MPAFSEATQLLHVFDDLHARHGAVNPPVYHASLYAYPDYDTWKRTAAGEIQRITYNRSGNPTVRLLEQKIAHLEGADDCVASASGMSAVAMTLLGLLESGDHLLVIKTVYVTARLLIEELRKFGLEVSYFEASDSADLSLHLRENTKLIWLESPSSGLFQIQDLPAVVRLARARGILTAIDNTWATPLYQKPLAIGLDLSIHAGTKYISGHSDLMLGLVAGRAEPMAHIRRTANLLGASLGPDDAYLALRGLRTLPTRLRQHSASARKVAEWLAQHPEVEEVLHPGRPDFPGHAIHRRQCQADSGLFSVRLRPADEPARAAFVDSLQLFTLGVSWGGYESLLSPLAFNYYGDDELRQWLGLSDHIYRLSIGLEDPDDLILDLQQALAIYAAKRQQ